MQRKQISKEQALQKLRHYCGYQERCHQEVKEKLFSLGLRKSDQDAVIATLIEEDYLNELRFATSYAGGKFRSRQWGREKIKSELKSRKVSEYCIKKALEQIDGEEYLKAIQKLYEKKWASLDDEPNKFIRKQKTRDYLFQHGYESGIIAEIMK